jgi:hypothetical protein
VVSSPLESARQRGLAEDARTSFASSKFFFPFKLCALPLSASRLAFRASG